MKQTILILFLLIGLNMTANETWTEQKHKGTLHQDDIEATRTVKTHERRGMINTEPNEQDPAIIYSYHTILDQLRLYYNPAKGYKFTDIFRALDDDFDGPVNLVSKDGSEQTFLVDYFENAFLLYENDMFSLYAPDIPSKQWIKDIMLISMNNKTLFFYENVNKTDNKKYQEFVQTVSHASLFVTYPRQKKITDWDNIDWRGISFVGMGME